MTDIVEASMLVKIFIYLLLFLISGFLSAEHIPAADNRTEYMNRFAVIAHYGNWNPYFELHGRYDNFNSIPDENSITIGSYYRTHKNLKLGLFYRLQSGIQHDDDWKFLDPGWEWKDSSLRMENLIILDATPRISFELFNFKNTTASLKTRYFVNFYNNHQILLLRPGLTYFYMKDRSPLWNFSLNYNLYNAVNFSDELVYEYGPYASFIYHFNRLLKFETSFKHSTKKWTTGSDSNSLGDSYSVNERKIILGLGIIFTPSF
jgi:hypothetical protein